MEECIHVSILYVYTKLSNKSVAYNTAITYKHQTGKGGITTHPVHQFTKSENTNASPIDTKSPQKRSASHTKEQKIQMTNTSVQLTPTACVLHE